MSSSQPTDSSLLPGHEPVYEGQFGSFSITPSDRRGVWIYRLALNGAALSFAIGTAIVVLGGESFTNLQRLSGCYAVFWLCLGIALATIHIYLVVLHRVLQVFWLVGGLASLWISLSQPDPLGLYVYQHPTAILGVGFTFAALTGVFFKEGFCFDRWETKLLTPIVPGLLLGHLGGLLPAAVEQGGLILWAILFVSFGLNKFGQAVPGDIGDKSVFEYLKTAKDQPV
ncbi:MAG: DUF2301 domain-containing membrane protein [Prochlorotrichaceae cyanobacterium]